MVKTILTALILSGLIMTSAFADSQTRHPASYIWTHVPDSVSILIDFQTDIEDQWDYNSAANACDDNYAVMAKDDCGQDYSLCGPFYVGYSIGGNCIDSMNLYISGLDTSGEYTGLCFVDYDYANNSTVYGDTNWIQLGQSNTFYPCVGHGLWNFWPDINNFNAQKYGVAIIPSYYDRGSKDRPRLYVDCGFGTIWTNEGTALYWINPDSALSTDQKYMTLSADAPSMNRLHFIDLRFTLPADAIIDSIGIYALAHIDGYANLPSSQTLLGLKTEDGSDIDATTLTHDGWGATDVTAMAISRRSTWDPPYTAANLDSTDHGPTIQPPSDVLGISGATFCLDDIWETAWYHEPPVATKFRDIIIEHHLEGE